jgi:hypothetical protein
VDLSGWFLGNVGEAITADDYRMFRIPDGTVVPAGGYVTFDESDFNPNGEWNPTPGTPGEGEFSLDGNRGGKLWLVSANPANGKLLNFEQEVEFSPVLPGISYGRWPDGSGPFAPLQSFTAESANASPRVGPVQITEIHYHPAGATPEFVEIANTSGDAQAMDQWTLRGDVDFDFPAGFSIAPAEAVVMVAFDPVLVPAQASSFRSQYDVPAGARLIGPWSAADSLGDTAGEVRLRRVVPPPAEEPGYVGLMVEDEANYLSTSLKQGNDPAAWIASTPAPGAGVGGYAAWSLATFGVSGEAKTGDPDGDGLSNLMEYLLGSDPQSPTSLTSGLDSNEENPRFVLEYTLRKDRDDASLTAWQSDEFQTWIPAINDELISEDGASQSRRAWLPLAERGFLRLEASEDP